MPGMTISDADVEALLERREPSDPDLAGLSAALARIDLQRIDLGKDERAGAFSLRAATLARRSRMSSQAPVPWWRRVAPRLVTSALAVVVLISMAGVAAASDKSAPGDFLYGIDQALEAVGINDGGIDERLSEATVLADNGHPVEALDHAADALDSTSPEAAEALHAAAESVGQGQTANVEVAQMLQWMANTEATGRVFGQDVAERARNLGADKPSSGESTDVPGPPTSNPGKSGEAPGSSVTPGNSENAPPKSEDAPGRSQEAPDNSQNAPGKNGDDTGSPGNGPPGGSPPGRGD